MARGPLRGSRGIGTCTYVPKILAMEQQDESLESLNENRDQKALEILDRKLRSGGAAHKAPAVFAIYEVYDACTHVYKYALRYYSYITRLKRAKASIGVEISRHSIFRDFYACFRWFINVAVSQITWLLYPEFMASN